MVFEAQESMRYILEASNELSKIQEIDEFTMLFEADSAEVQDQMKINQEASGKSTGFLQKAINSILNLIKKVIESIQNFFSYTFASKENKAKFQEFKAACLADPNLRDKKITYLDYKKTMDEYDRALAEAERLDKELAAERQAEVDAVVNRLTELASGVGKAATMSVGLKTLENIMEADQGSAEAILAALNMDERVLKNIEETLGSGRASKFSKNVQICAGKRISLRRAMVLLRRRKQLTLQDVMKNTANELKNEFSGKWGIMNSATHGITADMLHNKSVQDIVQGNDEVAKTVRDTGVRIYGAYSQAKKKGAKEAFKENIKSAVGLSSQDPKRMDRKMKKEEAKRKKTMNQSKHFFTGK